MLATHSAEGSLQSHADPQQHKARSSSSPLNAQTALRQHAPPKPARLRMLRPGSMVPPLHALAPRASERSGASLLREDGLIWRAGNAERWLAAVNGLVLSGRRSTGVEELAAAGAQEQRWLASEGRGHHCAGVAGLPHGMSGDRGHGGGTAGQGKAPRRQTNRSHKIGETQCPGPRSVSQTLTGELLPPGLSHVTRGRPRGRWPCNRTDRGRRKAQLRRHRVYSSS